MLDSYVKVSLNDINPSFHCCRIKSVGLKNKSLDFYVLAYIGSYEWSDRKAGEILHRNEL